MGLGFEKEFNDILNDNEDEFTYRGEEEFTPTPQKDDNQDDNQDEQGEPKKKKKKKPIKNNKKPIKNKPSKPASKNDNKQFIAKIIVASFLVSGGLLFWKFGPLSADTNNQEIASENTNKDALPKLSDSEDSPKPEETEDTGEPSVTLEDGEIKPGLPDVEKGDHNTNTGEVTDSAEFLKDINGSQIPKHYEVKKINYETDFVSYTKKRGVTGDGVELLWLDAEYKGNPYVIQVPFKVWKELDETGITVVDMEVLTIDKNLKVISNMKVKDNYKEIMEKGEKAVKKD